MSRQNTLRKEQVRQFYALLWDAHDKEAVPQLLHENVTFRGSLGQETQGHDGFADYVDMVHNALGDFRCIIDELVSDGDKVCARMTFTGIHRGEFMGHAPTLKRISWHGCALFSFDGERIADVWVLGDLKGLEDQLMQNKT